ncbi:HDOD domain-containing protein [Nitrincola nitratireducens]|uniref:HDOD domain protein n=1 Tax=Nitrincola nitratireducens TaxID=1229521 RepID=W9V0J9_9GAMM|nr:HDOD domain-containing protein [Nitrincola nitratireducens]EXJ10486.1 HDOD domain protein [Nitrincola nitratireducens]
MWGIKLSVGVSLLPKIEPQVLRLALLHDKQGKVLVILPASALLNLASVWRVTGRLLQPVSGSDSIRFFSQGNLLTERAQKKLLSLSLMVDIRAYDLPEVEFWEPYTGLRFTPKASWYSKPDFQGDLSVSSESIMAQVPAVSDVEAISLALERFSALRVKQRLDETLALPSFGPTTQKLVNLRSDPSASVQALINIVRLDASLSAQVMSWATSAYYAAPGKVDSLEDAVIRVLGFDLVVNLALGVAMGKVLHIPDTGVRGATPFWLESISVAAFAEQLSLRMPVNQRPKPGLVYLSGLLHNFGYLLLAHLFPAQFSTLTRYIEANPHLSIHLIEKQLLKLTREQLAAWLFESWKLPAEVCHAIRFQNEDDSNAYTQLLQISIQLLRQQHLCDGPIDEHIDESVLSQLGLTLAITQEAMTEFQDHYIHLEALSKQFIAEQD